MKNYLKTAAALCLTAGLLFGCSGYTSKPDYRVRNEAYKKLKMFGQESYTINLEDKSITARIDKIHFDVEIRDTKTGNILRLIDRRAHPGPTPRHPEYMPFDGIDAAYFNGIRVTAEDKNYTDLKLLEKTFNDATLKVVSSLEEKLQKSIRATEPLITSHVSNVANEAFEWLTEPQYPNMVPYTPPVPLPRWMGLFTFTLVGVSFFSLFYKIFIKKKERE